MSIQAHFIWARLWWGRVFLNQASSRYATKLVAALLLWKYSDLKDSIWPMKPNWKVYEGFQVFSSEIGPNFFTCSLCCKLEKRLESLMWQSLPLKKIKKMFIQILKLHKYFLQWKWWEKEGRCRYPLPSMNCTIAGGRTMDHLNRSLLRYWWRHIHNAK